MKRWSMFVPLLLAGCATLDSDRILTQPEFAQVRQGMSRDDTKRLLGSPYETMSFARSGTQSWDYRFQDAWGYTSLFSVVFGPQGTVVGTSTQRLNDGGDHQ
jgi:outer membrane protein assembly factor BamE (lipoprotein component of BamABCDE complex)